MKTPRLLPLFLITIHASLLFAGQPDAERLANLVILDETAIRNLSIETEVVEETPFEETIFALGRVEAAPGRRAIISSRIPGRALEVLIRPAQAIEKNASAIVVESRQTGNPPPSVTLSAPLSGLVSAVNVVIGQPVEPGDALAEIIDLTEVTAIARVPEHLTAKLRPGLTARITAPAVPGRVFEATLEYLSAQADAATGTIEAAFRVTNPELTLRPGMRAEFSIVVDKKDNVFSVPRSALQGDATNRFVFVKDFELPNAFVKTPVVVGRINDRRAEILSGLFPADEVVTRGAYSLAFAGGGSVSLKDAWMPRTAMRTPRMARSLTMTTKRRPSPPIRTRTQTNTRTPTLSG
jgi:cobalt-zinc-cadmium efflux system membrane fusion protein